jgi:4'-phosphopantetheinyl transferase EntD
VHCTPRKFFANDYHGCMLRLPCPLGGSIVVGPVVHEDLAMQQLTPEEHVMAASYGHKRIRTFAAGRLLLRTACADVGADVQTIGRSARGAPLLPARVRGSISHKDDWAAAWAMNPVDSDMHIGVDLELDDPLSIDIARHILTDDERSGLPADEDERRRCLLQMFALKEALYKAIDPFVHRFVGFHEVQLGPLEEVDGIDNRMDGRVARATFDVLPADAHGLRTEAYLVRHSDGPWGRTLWLAVVAVSR